jgi:PAS domain S-box-containing protein
VEEILRMTIEKVTRSLGFDRVVLLVLDEKKGALAGKWSIGISEEIVQRVQIPREEMKGILLETFNRREPIPVQDTSSYPIIEEREIRRCWEVLNCQEEICPVFRTKELRCWMMKGTRCHREMAEETFEEKMHVCGKCLYFNQEIIRRSDIVNLLLFGSQSFISVPLIARDLVFGILLADKLHSQREITEDDIKLLTTFMSCVSIALETAILYQKLERKVDLGQRQLEETNDQLQQKLDELNEIRSFNESVLQNLYGGIVTCNKGGIITFMNQPGAELLGWREQEVLGRSIHEVLCTNGTLSFFEEFLAGNGALSSDTEIKKKTGEKIPVEIFLSQLRDEKGNITGVTGIFRDITEKCYHRSKMDPGSSLSRSS